MHVPPSSAAELRKLATASIRTASCQPVVISIAWSTSATVPPTQAGVPGKGPWFLYAGPVPFKGYKVSDKPSGAKQMCILVARMDHSVQQNTGNCVDLPA